MLLKLQNYFGTIKPVFIDGALYALVAWMIFNQAYFGGDEAAKYIDPITKFWLVWGIGSGATIVGAIKTFRSTAFAEHQEAKKEEKTNGI